MKKLLLLAVLFNGILAFSSIPDTTIFTTDFEKEVFLEIADSNQVDPLSLLTGIDYDFEQSERIKKKLDRITQELNQKGIGTKNKKKQIKTIYQHVHKSVLKKYVEEAYFNDLFESGEYNCVSASALYALVLDRFNINYMIKETPRHVYIIADTSEYRITIESTLPQKGVFVFDEKFKRDFVKFLADGKLISKEEYNMHSTDYLFDKHYDQNKTIDIYQLAALQYYNKGVFSFNKESYLEASKNFEKAYLLYPSNNVKYMYNLALANVLNSQYLSKNFNGVFLAKFLNINVNNPEAIAYGKEFFGEVTNEWVINRPNPDNYNNFYTDFSQLLSHEIEFDDFSQTYYHILAYYDYSQRNYASALEKLNFAYIANPDNIEIKQLIENVGYKYIFTDREHELMLDTMEYYFEVFPFLYGLDNYQRYYTYCFSKSIEQAVLDEDIKKSMIYLNRFEGVLSQNPEINFDNQHIESIYSLLALHYLKKQKYSTALTYTQKGLAIVPQSRNLKEVKNGIKVYISFMDDRTPSLEEILVPTIREEFGETFHREFPKCWKAVSVNEAGETTELPWDERIEISASSNKKAEFRYNNEKQSGKWAVRTKSKLLYLIPERDKDDYIMFRIVEIDKNTLKLKAYENGKWSKTIITFQSCE